MGTKELLQRMVADCSNYRSYIADIENNAGVRWAREIAQPNQIAAVINLGTMTPEPDEFAAAVGIDSREVAELFGDGSTVHGAVSAFILGVWGEASCEEGRRWAREKARPDEIAAMLGYWPGDMGRLFAVARKELPTPLAEQCLSAELCFYNGVCDVAGMRQELV